MVGLDQFITKNATLTNEKADDAHPIKAMKFSVSPVVSFLLLLAFQTPCFMTMAQEVAAVGHYRPILTYYTYDCNNQCHQ